MWLHTAHSREQLENQGHLHLLPDPGPVAEQRETMDLTETVKVKRWTFHKPDYFQKHTGIHSLWVLELHHRSLQSPERILCCVGSEDDSRDPFARSSRCSHCGTAEHQFQPQGCPPHLRQLRHIGAKTALLLLNWIQFHHPLLQTCSVKIIFSPFLISLPCLHCRTKRTEKKNQLDFIWAFYSESVFQHKTNKKGLLESRSVYYVQQLPLLLSLDIKCFEAKAGLFSMLGQHVAYLKLTT